MLSSIASSADEGGCGALNRTRESRSMDMIPTSAESVHEETWDDEGEGWPAARRSSSLDKCTFGGVGAVRASELVTVSAPGSRDSLSNNNSFPNGNVPVRNPASGGGGTAADIEDGEDVEAPLLRGRPVTVVHRRRVGDAASDKQQSQPAKRWRSLEAVIGEGPAAGGEPSKKQPGGGAAHNSFKSWLVGIFNGNGLRASNSSLRKASVLAGYNDLQVERESIV